MSNIPTWVTDIERLALGKPVLLVEGEDDIVLFRHFFNQHTPGWDLRLHLAAAGSKRHVIADEQLTHYVHGKKFYTMVVVQILDHLFSGKGADDWLQKFRDAPIRPPDDLKDLLDWVWSLVS